MQGINEIRTFEQGNEKSPRSANPSLTFTEMRMIIDALENLACERLLAPNPDFKKADDLQYLSERLASECYKWTGRMPHVKNANTKKADNIRELHGRPRPLYIDINICD